VSLVPLVRRRCMRGAREERNQGDRTLHSDEPQTRVGPVCDLRRSVGRTGDLRAGVLMPEERSTWIKHSYNLALLTAGFHSLQCASSVALWTMTNSAALASFGLDAIVSAVAALLLAIRIHRSFETLDENWRSRSVAYGYIAASAVAVWLGGRQLWLAER